MQKNYLSYYFDFVFYSLIIFFITFIWVRSFVHNNLLIWVYSVSITLIISILLSIILKKKIYKYKLTKSEYKEKLKFSNQLIFSLKSEINNFLQQFFKSEKIKKHKEFFTFGEHNENAVFNEFTLDSLSLEKLLNYIKQAEKLKCENMLIFCTNYNKDCLKVTKNLKKIKVKLINFDNFYVGYIKKQNISPTFEIKYEEKTGYKFKELLSIAFNKNKTKNYVFTGLIFLIGSIFMRYNIYYLVFTSIMFIFALFSYFNTIYNKKTDE